MDKIDYPPSETLRPNYTPDFSSPPNSNPPLNNQNTLQQDIQPKPQLNADPQFQTLDTLLAKTNPTPPSSNPVTLNQTPITPIPPLTQIPINNSADKKMVILGLSAIVLFCLLATIIFSKAVMKTAKKQEGLANTPTSTALENMTIVTPGVTGFLKGSQVSVNPTQQPIPKPTRILKK